MRAQHELRIQRVPADAASRGNRARHALRRARRQRQRLHQCGEVSPRARMSRFLHQRDRRRRQGQRLAQHGADRLALAAHRQSPRHLGGIHVGAQIQREARRPVAGDRIPDRRGQRIDRATLDPGRGQHRLTAHGPAVEAQRDTLQRRARMPREMRRPGQHEADIGRREGHKRHARQQRRPATIRAQPRPGGTTECQHHRIRRESRLTLRRREARRGALQPDPAMPRAQLHTQPAEPPHPGAQQRRGLQRLREDAARTPNEGLDAKPLAPGDQRRGRKGAHRVQQHRRLRPVVRQEGIERLGMRQVQPAAPGHQEFPGGRRHMVEDRHRGTCLGERLRRNQPCRPRPDHRDFHHGCFLRPSGRDIQARWTQSWSPAAPASSG